MNRVRGIGARGLFALLLIAAVLSMHGIPSMGTAQADPIGASATSHTAMGMSPDAPVEMSGALAGVSAIAQDGLAGGLPSDTPHEGTAHLWAACLAVLLAGLLLVGAAVLARRRARGRDVDAGWPVAVWGMTRCHLPRPPDLFALCVMRT